MAKFTKKMGKKVAQLPGSLIHVGEKKMDRVSLQEIAYDRDHVFEKRIDDLESYSLPVDFKGVTWVSMTGVHDTAIMERMGKIFGIHSLTLEDILNTFQRPKIEDFGDYIFLVLRMLEYNPESHEVISEQVSFVVGANFVITFQEREGDVFKPVRERIQKGRGKIREMKADYLLYALADCIVDNYFLIMETIGEDIEEIETQLLDHANPRIAQSIQKLRKELIFLRKGIWPLREVINTLLRGDCRMIKKKTLLYIKDIYDHTIQVIETTETYRDMVSGLHDLYLSGISNRMNEIMKVLTIISTLFIPLTFVAGIYGMNFEVMPELKWKFGYFFTWIIMAGIGLGMFIYFKRKKWI